MLPVYKHNQIPEDQTLCEYIALDLGKIGFTPYQSEKRSNVGQFARDNNLTLRAYYLNSQGFYQGIV